MPSDAEYYRQRNYNSGASDYRLVAAQGDELIQALTTLLENKLNMDRDTGSVLSIIASNMLGIQNRGVSLASAIQDPIERFGVGAYMKSGNYSGTIGGTNMMALEASKAITQTIQQTFFRENGLAKREAFGMNQSEIGGIVGNMMRAGSQYSFGPMYQSEILTKERIGELRKQAIDRGMGGAKIREIERLEEGQVYTSINEANMQKFQEYTKKAVRVVSGLKDMLGSSDLKKLDEVLTQTLGMTLPEFGFDNADRLFSKVRAAGATYFGGDNMKALAMLNTNSQTTALNLAAAFGGDPTQAVNYLGVSAGIAAYSGFASMYGGQANVMNSGMMRGSGFDTRIFSKDHIQEQHSKDAAMNIKTNKEALAVASLLQIQGAAMDGNVREEMERALADLSTGDQSPDAISAKMARLSDLFYEETGQSVAGFLGNDANQARLLANLRGDSLDKYTRTISKMGESKRNYNVRYQYENAVFGQNTGLGAEALGEAGQFVANLSGGQYQDFRKAVEEGTLDQFFANPERKGMLQGMMREMGIEEDYDTYTENIKTHMRMLAGETPQDQVDKLNMIRANRNQMPGTSGFVGAGAKMEERNKQFNDMLQAYLHGGGEPRGDTITELLKGFYGDETVASRDLVSKARELGIDTKTMVLDKNNNIVLDGARGDKVLQELKSTEKGQQFLDDYNIKDVDQLRAIMKDDPVMRTELFRAVTSSGAFDIKKGDGGRKIVEYLGAEDAQEAERAITADRYAEILGTLAGEDADKFDDVTKRKVLEDGETLEHEDAYEKRMRDAMKEQLNNATAKGRDKLIEKASKDKKLAEALTIAAAESGQFQKENILEGIENEYNKLQKDLKDYRETPDSKMSDEEKKDFDAKSIRLAQLAKMRDDINGRTTSAMSTETIHTTVIKADKLEAPPATKGK